MLPNSCLDKIQAMLAFLIEETDYQLTLSAANQSA